MDFMFFLLVIITLLNIIFGIIIDTFSELRTNKDELERLKQTTCYMCGIDKKTLDQETLNGYQHHWLKEHNVWFYVGYIVHLKAKEVTELNGLEQHVIECLDAGKIDWYPRMRAMGLVQNESEAMDKELVGESINEQLIGLGSALSVANNKVQVLSDALVASQRETAELKRSLRDLMLHLGMRPTSEQDGNALPNRLSRRSSTQSLLRPSRREVFESTGVIR
jgi:hypothetical protein